VYESAAEATNEADEPEQIAVGPDMDSAGLNTLT
jgi:hypothetical protein